MAVKISYELVLVEWVDSHAGRGWQDIGKISDSCELLHCKTVGWIVKRTRDCVAIAPHISMDGDGNILQGCGDITIPAKSIVRIEHLKCQRGMG